MDRDLLKEFSIEWDLSQVHNFSMINPVLTISISKKKIINQRIALQRFLTVKAHVFPTRTTKKTEKKNDIIYLKNQSNCCEHVKEIIIMEEKNNHLGE